MGETAADPHDATRGFFYAHIGWLLVKKDPEVVKAGREMDFSDLMADPFVALEKNFGIPSLLQERFDTYASFILHGVSTLLHIYMVIIRMISCPILLKIHLFRGLLLEKDGTIGITSTHLTMLH